VVKLRSVQAPVNIVECGTPVRGCPTSVVQIEPSVQFAHADPSAGYVVMMLDAATSNRHWLLGNVPGSALRAGFKNENTTPGVEILSPY
jgi:hypothetical protein